MNTGSYRGTVRTKSAVRAWFLQTFCGHRLRSRWLRPRYSLLGQLIYERRYVLVSADGMSAMIH